MKNKKEKTEYINNLPSETAIHDMLEELLPEMGYKDVTITHERGNKPEDGKDLICSQFDEIENKKDWVAFVVKKGKIIGTSSAINEIENQAIDCFKYEYKDILKKEKINIGKVKIVVNQHFTAGAQSKITRNENLQKANVDFWDGSKIVGFIDSYYKDFWIRGSKSYKKYIKRFTEKIKVDNTSITLGINDKKIEKIINSAIEPLLSERTQDEEGRFIYKTKSVNTILKIPDNSIVIGEPGAGKTTLFKQLSNEIIAQNSIRNDVEFYPIIITFNELKVSDFNLENSIETYFSNDWNIDLEINYSSILKENRCVIFIDALDELPKLEDRKSALKSIQDFKSSYPNIKVICSSRPSDYLFYNCETDGFRYLSINPLQREQIEHFVSSYFNDSDIKSKRLLKSLRDSEILEKLPKTPLTLALITILFDENEVEIPATITDLYENFVDLLLGKYQPTDSISIIEIGVKKRLLCHIAKKMHIKKIKMVSFDVLLKWITEYSTERGQKIKNEEIVNDIIENTGLLYKNSKDEIQFKHLSFQEYFVAYDIFHHRQSDRNLFIKNFNNIWWQNVAIFYAGFTKDAPNLLDIIIKKSKPSKNINEYVTNTIGIGKLLQALYNTPIEKRENGILRGIDNTVNAINLIENSSDENIIFWKNFSKFSIMQLFGGLFKFSNWSVTLIEPIKNIINQLNSIDKNSIEQSEMNNLEFKLFLLSSILASDEFLSFDEFKLFIEKAKLDDIYLIAIIDTHLIQLKKHLSKEQWRDVAQLKSITRKINKIVKSIKNLTEVVNTPLKKQIRD